MPRVCSSYKSGPGGAEGWAGRDSGRGEGVSLWLRIEMHSLHPLALFGSSPSRLQIEKSSGVFAHSWLGFVYERF